MKNKDEIIYKYNSEIEKKSTKIPVIMFATDTYDMLKDVGYNENEALKLTEIICNNKWSKEKCSSIDYLANVIDDKVF
ncbi:MAG: hypothetical protein Q4P17_11390 [Methanobacterium sp.]|nr:hypothetical protein [Methanobacterium sp.]